MTKKVILDRICNVYIISALLKKCLKISMQKYDPHRRLEGKLPEQHHEHNAFEHLNIFTIWALWTLWTLWTSQEREKSNTNEHTSHMKIWTFGHSYTLNIMNLFRRTQRTATWATAWLTTRQIQGGFYLKWENINLIYLVQ